jgi:transposase-like protein
MVHRYTEEEKAQALAVITEREGSIPQAAVQTGISPQTLRRWWKVGQAGRRSRLQSRLERAQEKLADNALKLSAAIGNQMDDAPLSQLATALNAVINQYMKLEEHLATFNTGDKGENVVRLEHKYPDGTLHDKPHWARNNPEYESPFPGRGVREAVRQDGDGQAGYRPQSDERGEMLVAGSDLPDGDAGLAGLERGVAGGGRVDQRNGAAH